VTRIVVDTSSGWYVVRANLTNTSAAYLNDVVLRWSARSSAGGELATGTLLVAGLAPGETASASSTEAPVAGTVWSWIAFTYQG